MNVEALAAKVTSAHFENEVHGRTYSHVEKRVEFETGTRAGVEAPRKFSYICIYIYVMYVRMKCMYVWNACMYVNIHACMHVM